jgi:hypothetical protein
VPRSISRLALAISTLRAAAVRVCGALPPWAWQTVLPSMAKLRQQPPFERLAEQGTAGRFRATFTRERGDGSTGRMHGTWSMRSRHSGQRPAGSGCQAPVTTATIGASPSASGDRHPAGTIPHYGARPRPAETPSRTPLAKRHPEDFGSSPLPTGQRGLRPVLEVTPVGLARRVVACRGMGRSPSCSRTWLVPRRWRTADALRVSTSPTRSNRGRTPVDLGSGKRLHGGSPRPLRGSHRRRSRRRRTCRRSSY